MTIAVTGATGNLGRLTIAALLGRGVAAADIVAVVRDAAKAADWYWENYESAVGTARETGALFGAAGTGRVAGAARKDYAEAAAAVLLADDAAGKVYELGGDRLTYTELAEALSGVVGKPVVYKDLSREEYTQVLEGAGVPSQFAAVLADSDAGIAAGALDTESGDLQRLIGRDATPVADVLRG
ncbi:hypothetical protein [Rhodococcus sp. O3]|uniref:hypothetical protein n=1 Tax=Rhodococcus sp. O3 TaxID=3404919 RepID=UPI003B66E9A0